MATPQEQLKPRQTVYDPSFAAWLQERGFIEVAKPATEEGGEDIPVNVRQEMADDFKFFLKDKGWSILDEPLPSREEAAARLARSTEELRQLYMQRSGATIGPTSREKAEKATMAAPSAIAVEKGVPTIGPPKGRERHTQTTDVMARRLPEERSFWAQVGDVWKLLKQGKLREAEQLFVDAGASGLTLGILSPESLSKLDDLYEKHIGGEKYFSMRERRASILKNLGYYPTKVGQPVSFVYAVLPISKVAKFAKGAGAAISSVPAIQRLITAAVGGLTTGAAQVAGEKIAGEKFDLEKDLHKVPPHMLWWGLFEFGSLGIETAAKIVNWNLKYGGKLAGTGKYGGYGQAQGIRIETEYAPGRGPTTRTDFTGEELRRIFIKRRGMLRPDGTLIDPLLDWEQAAYDALNGTPGWVEALRRGWMSPRPIEVLPGEPPVVTGYRVSRTGAVGPRIERPIGENIQMTPERVPTELWRETVWGTEEIPMKPSWGDVFRPGGATRPWPAPEIIGEPPVSRVIPAPGAPPSLGAAPGAESPAQGRPGPIPGQEQPPLGPPPAGSAPPAVAGAPGARGGAGRQAPPPPRGVAPPRPAERVARATKEPIREPVVPREAPVDEPWRMTQGEFYESRKAGAFPLDPAQAKNIHRYEVEAAIKSGKTVRPEVLKDYPELEVPGAGKEFESLQEAYDYFQDDRSHGNEELGIAADEVLEADFGWKRGQPLPQLDKASVPGFARKVEARAGELRKEAIPPKAGGRNLEPRDQGLRDAIDNIRSGQGTPEDISVLSRAPRDSKRFNEIIEELRPEIERIRRRGLADGIAKGKMVRRAIQIQQEMVKLRDKVETLREEGDPDGLMPNLEAQRRALSKEWEAAKATERAAEEAAKPKRRPRPGTIEDMLGKIPEQVREFEKKPKAKESPEEHARRIFKSRQQAQKKRGVVGVPKELLENDVLIKSIFELTSGIRPIMATGDYVKPGTVSEEYGLLPKWLKNKNGMSIDDLQARLDEMEISYGDRLLDTLSNYRNREYWGAGRDVEGPGAERDWEAAAKEAKELAADKEKAFDEFVESTTADADAVGMGEDEAWAYVEAKIQAQKAYEEKYKPIMNEGETFAQFMGRMEKEAAEAGMFPEDSLVYADKLLRKKVGSSEPPRGESFLVSSTVKKTGAKKGRAWFSGLTDSKGRALAVMDPVGSVGTEDPVDVYSRQIQLDYDEKLALNIPEMRLTMLHWLRGDDPDFEAFLAEIKKIFMETDGYFRGVSNNVPLIPSVAFKVATEKSWHGHRGMRMFHLKWILAHDFAVRLFSEATGRPPFFGTHAFLMGQLPAGHPLAGSGIGGFLRPQSGELFINAHHIPPGALEDPWIAAGDIRDVVIHELTHYMQGAHNEAFESTRVALSHQTSHLVPYLARVAEKITGKTAEVRKGTTVIMLGEGRSVEIQNSLVDLAGDETARYVAKTKEGTDAERKLWEPKPVTKGRKPPSGEEGGTPPAEPGQPGVPGVGRQPGLSYPRGDAEARPPRLEFGARRRGWEPEPIGPPEGEFALTPEEPKPEPFKPAEFAEKQGILPMEPETELFKKKPDDKFLILVETNKMRPPRPQPRPLPKQPRVPEEGTYLAVRTDDGGLYFREDIGTEGDHYTLVQKLGIPPERVVGGGFIRNGDYIESPWSEAGRMGRDARDEMGLPRERFSITGATPSPLAAKRAVLEKIAGMKMGETPEEAAITVNELLADDFPKNNITTPGQAIAYIEHMAEFKKRLGKAVTGEQKAKVVEEMFAEEPAGRKERLSVTRWQDQVAGEVGRLTAYPNFPKEWAGNTRQEIEDNRQNLMRYVLENYDPAVGPLENYINRNKGFFFKGGRSRSVDQPATETFDRTAEERELDVRSVFESESAPKNKPLPEPEIPGETLKKNVFGSEEIRAINTIRKAGQGYARKIGATGATEDTIVEVVKARLLTDIPESYSSLADRLGISRKTAQNYFNGALELMAGDPDMIALLRSRMKQANLGPIPSEEDLRRMAKMLRKLFSSYRGADKIIDAENDLRIGGRMAEIFEQTLDSGKLMKWIDAQPAGVNEYVLDIVQGRITGDGYNDIAASALPDNIKEILKRFRRRADSLSELIIAHGGLADDTKAAFERNLGKYLTKAYQLWDNKRWDPSEADRRGFKDYLMREFNLTDAQADEFIEAELSYASNDENLRPRRRRRTRRVPTDNYIRRRDLSPEWRKFAGEIDRVPWLMLNTVSKQASMAYNAKFLDWIKDYLPDHWVSTYEEAAGRGWQNSRLPEHNYSYGTLAGKWVDPELFQYIKSEVDVNRSDVEDWVQKVIMNPFKWTKTIGSYPTHMRNALGNTMFSHLARTSVLNPLNARWYKKAVEIHSQKTGAQRDMWSQLIRRGVTETQFYGADIPKIYDNIMKFEPDAWYDKLYDTFVHWPIDKLGELYNFEDSLYRVAAYLKMTAPRANGGFGMTPEGALEEINACLQNYRKLPVIVDFLRRWPILGPFVSFRWNVAKIIANQAKMGFEDMKIPAGEARVDPRTGVRHTKMGGLIRLLRLAGLLALPYILSEASKWTNNVDEEAIKELERWYPEYRRNGVFFYFRGVEGQLKVFDMSYLWPTGEFERFGRALIKGDLLGMKDALDFFSHPLFDVVSILVQGKDPQWGTKYRDVVERAKAAFSYLYLPASMPIPKLDALVEGELRPGALTGPQIKSIIDAFNQQPDQYGRVKSLPEEVKNFFTGIRTWNVDPEKLLAQAAVVRAGEIRELQREHTRWIIRNSKAPKSEKDDKTRKLKERIDRLAAELSDIKRVTNELRAGGFKVRKR